MNLTEKLALAVIATYERGDYDFSMCCHCNASNLGADLRAPHDEGCVVLEAYKYLQIPVPEPEPEYNTGSEDD